MNVADLFARLRLQADRSSFDVGQKLMTGIKVGLAAIAGFAGVQWFRGLINDTAELAGHALDVGRKFGITAEAVQELGFAAGQAGSSGEELEAGLGAFVRTLDAARKGSKDTKRAFRELGVDMRDLRGETVDQNLEVIADRFAAMPDGARKAALAMEIFGKSGASLIPFLNQGKDGIVALRKEAQDLGGVLSGKDAQALDDFGDEQAKVGFAVRGLKNEIALALLPTLREMVTDFLEWVKANRKMIAQKVAFVIKGIVFALRLLGKAVGFVIDVFEFFADHIGLLITLLGALGGAMLIVQAKSVAAALASAAAWVLAALPFIAIAAAIAALILIVQDLYSWFNGGDSVLKDLYNSFVTWLGETAIGRVLGGIKAAFAATFDWIADKIMTVWNALKAVADYLAELVEGGTPEEFAKPFQTGTVDEQIARARAMGATITAEDEAIMRESERTGESERAIRKRRTGDEVAQILGGGGLGSTAQQTATAASDTTVAVMAPQMTAQISVTVPPGANAPETAQAVRAVVENFWDMKMRELYDGEGEP